MSAGSRGAQWGPYPEGNLVSAYLATPSTNLCRMRRWVAHALPFLLAACTRTYEAAPPRVATHPAVNMAVYGMAMTFGPNVEVRLSSSGLAGTLLRGAKLASLSSEPCSEGVEFDRIESDGIERLEGPLDLHGAHDLVVAFFHAGSSVTEPSAVDIELDTPTGRSCTRVPLRGTDGTGWKARDDGNAG